MLSQILLIISYFCALLPLVIGSLTFVIWYMTRQPLLMIVGGWLLMIGPILALIGFLTVAWYRRTLHQTRPWWKRPLALNIFLTLNFVIAALYLYWVSLIMDHIELEIQNRTETDIATIILFDSCSSELFLGSLQQHYDLKVSYPVKSDCSLGIKIFQNHRVSTGIINEYMIGDGREDSTVIIRSNQIQVIPRFKSLWWPVNSNGTIPQR